MLGSLSSPTSSKFYILCDNDNNSKIVISDIASEARFTNQVLQLHFAGINLNNETDSNDPLVKINLVGSVQDLKDKSKKALSKELENLPEADQRILFVGARKTVMEGIDRKLDPHNTRHDLSGDDFYNHLKNDENAGLKSYKSGCFVFDVMTRKEGDKTIQYCGLRMPNGDLAHDAVEVFLQHGFNNIVMCGAGGRLNGTAQVGDYIEVSSAKHGKQMVTLDKKGLNINVKSPAQFGHLKKDSISNVTVDSPLQETVEWLNAAKGKENMGSVDVETAHIFKAITEHQEKEDIKLPSVSVISGMFISDVVGDHPLSEKIAGGGADKYMNDFISTSIDALRH